MLVKTASNAAHERDGDEYRREYQGNGNHGALHLRHRLGRRFTRAHALLDVMLDRLDHDNGIIDNETNGQHEAKQR